MASLEFNRQEVENLAQKLDSVQAQLSEGERALLLAVFAAASDRVDTVVQAAGAKQTTADLRDQIVKAFIPGDDDVYVIPYRIGYIEKPTPKPVPTPTPTPNPAAPTPAEERPAAPPPSDAPPAQP